jgi:hypothetical protein
MIADFRDSIPGVFLGKEEIASMGVIEKKCERIMRFGVIGDCFGNNSYPEMEE